MKLTRLVALSVILAAASAPVADARPRPAGRIQGKSFEANKTFGLGLELGSPSGLTGKYFLDNGSNALQFGLGSIYGYRDHYGFNLYFDYLWHPVSLVSASAFELPLFVGVGGRLWNFDDRRDRRYDDVFGFGVRVPIGIAFDFNEVPLDIFFQIVPTIDFYRGYRDNVGFWFDASIGIRFWFN
jgi:opacity protein-like surface antigen